MFVQPLLQCESSKYYIFRVYICSLKYPACNAHASYYFVICVCLAVLYFSNFSFSQTARVFGKQLLQIKFEVREFFANFV